MSPPRVSLAGKEPLKSIDLADEPQEKISGGEFPSVITVETERRARVLRYKQKQQRCRVLICGIALVVIVTVAALGTMAIVHRLRRHHRKNWTCGVKDYNVPENVRVDDSNKLIYAQHDHDDQMQAPAMEFLHEYNRGLVAYKDVDNNICYIDRLDETFEDGIERWEAYEVDDRDQKALKVISQPIEVKVLQHITDVHIYAHCENAKSVWVMEIERKEVTTAMEVVYV